MNAEKRLDVAVEELASIINSVATAIGDEDTTWSEWYESELIKALRRLHQARRLMDRPARVDRSE